MSLETTEDNATNDQIKNDVPSTASQKEAKRSNVAKNKYALTMSQGLSKIREADTILLRIYWLVIYVAFCVIEIWFAVMILQVFFSHETVTSILTRNEVEIEFPTVVFCDNKVLGHINDAELESEYYRVYSATTTAHPNETLTEKLLDIVLFEITYRYKLVEELKAKGDGIKQIVKENIVACVYNAKPCDMKKDITVTFEYGLGVCFHYNGVGAETAKTAVRPGDHNGLRINYVQPITKYDKVIAGVHSNDVKVFIQERGKQDLTYNGGFTLERGFESATGIGIKKVQTKRMAAPYGKCLDSLDENVYPFYAKTLELYKYYTQDQNNCSLAEYGSASSGQSQFDSCPSECSSIQYQISKGFKNLDDNFAQFMYGSLSRRLKNSTTVWELKDYALSFGVYYDSLVLVETEQSAKMDAWKVLADISGYMGLFSGTTCLSLAELIEIVIKHFFFQNL